MNWRKIFSWKWWAALGPVVALIAMRLIANWQRSRKAEYDHAARAAAVKEQRRRANAHASRARAEREQAMAEAKQHGAMARELGRKAQAAGEAADAAESRVADLRKKVQEARGAQELDELARENGF